MASRLQDVIMRDTRANQPLATDVSAGTLYFVTDEGVTERSNGTTWEAFSDTGVVSPIIVSAGVSSASISSLVFSNSNRISFGLSGSTITGSISALSVVNVSAPGSSNNISNIVFSNSNGVTFGLSGSTVTASISQSTSPSAINISAGTTSNNLSAFVISNSNNVSFGLNGSTITATVTIATSLTNVNISAGTTSNNLSNFIFSNSNGVSFGINGSTITGSVAAAIANIKVSAGASSANLTDITFSNSNGVSFGLSGSTITASVAVATGGAFTISNWANPAAEYWVDMRTSTPFANKIIVMPMSLAGVLSGEYLRFAVSMQSNLNRTFGAVSANTSWSAARQDTIHLQLYTRGTGASSVSLFSISNFSQGFTVQTSFNNGAASNEWSASLIASVGFGTGTTTFSTNYACTSNQYVINTANFGSVMDNTRWMEIPFNSSISAGQYYLGIARSTLTTKDAGGATGLSTTNFNYEIGVMSVTSGSIGRWGNNNNTIGLNFGMGNFTSNVQIISTDSMGTAQLLGTAAAAANIVPFMVL